MHVLDCEAGSGKLPDRLRTGFDKRLKNSGVEFALRYLKDESASCRSSWILKNGTDTQAQSSYVGRALPRGNSESLLASTKTHYNDLSGCFSTDKGVLSEARSFACRWGKRYLGDPTRMAASGVPTLSSCSESTVRQGGVRGFASKLGVHPSASALYDSLLSELPYQDASSVVSDLSLLFHGKDLLAAGLPASEVIALPERGLKVRVITKSPAGLHFLGHVVRKRLLSGLRRDPVSSSTLCGVKDEEVIKHFVGASSETCVSTDLSRASDLLPLDLVSAIVDGLSDSGRLPQMEVDVLRLLTGPQEIHYPSLDGAPTIVSRRGILMGLPTTWAILSLIHLFWWSRAVARVALRRRVPMKSAYAANRYTVCGDDGLFCGWTEVASEYLSLVHSSGGTESPGKHFVVSGCVRRRAVFLERLYQFEVSDGLITGGTRHSAIPLRGLVRPDVPEALRGHGSNLSLTNKIKMLFSVDAIWASHPGSEQVLCRFLRKRQDLYSFASRLFLVNGLPLKYGGSGLPVPTGPGLDARKHRYRAQMATSLGHSFPSLLRGVVDSTWQLSVSMMEADLAEYFSDGTFVELEEDASPPLPVKQAEYVVVGTKEEFLDQASASAYADLILQLGTETRTPRLREKALARAVKDWKRGLPALPSDFVDSDQYLFRPKVVWVLRTRGPSGKLLYPRWVGESLASEARLRATHAGVAWFSQASSRS
jgi:hypothetical protein